LPSSSQPSCSPFGQTLKTTDLGKLTGTYRSGGLTLGYQAHHLSDYPAEQLLDHPILYPLAVLVAAATQEHRMGILEAIITRSGANNATAAERSETIDITTTLAAVQLPTR
jgi:hypothetical protein